jgi:hypothetical protein
MSESKHTPFQFAEWNSGINRLPGYGLLDEDGISIGVTVHTMEITGFNRYEPKVDAADLARFVVHACNSHDDLLAALELMIEATQPEISPIDGKIELMPSANRIELRIRAKNAASAAIAKAKGEQS